MKGKVLAVLTAGLLAVTPVSVYAATEGQNLPIEAGETLVDIGDYDPMLMTTTAYYYGTIGSHGDRMRDGYVASSPELYGAAVAIYEAVDNGDGYELGDYIGVFEVRDTGYGYSTGEGKSRVRKDKKYAGTIESGLHLDVYKDSLDSCWDWMHLTNGMVYAVIVPQIEG